MDKDKLMLDYLKALLDRYGKYHDHKEVSAWAGIVLYFVFCAVVLHLEVSAPPHVIEFGTITVAVFVTAILATLYIRKQLELKDVAGSYVAAATYYMTKIVTSEAGRLDEPLTAIAQSTDTEIQSSHVLSDSFLTKAKWLNTQGRCAQIKTRWFTYSLLWTATLFVVTYKAVKYYC
jgi:hypothetical protein